MNRYKEFIYLFVKNGLTEEEAEKLISDIRKIALKKFYQMPKRHQSFHPKEEWSQDAYVAAWNEGAKFDPKKGVLFKRFITWRVNMRMIDKQRKIFQENPPINEELWKFVKSLTRELGRKPTAQELADRITITRTVAREFLETGTGQWRVVSENELSKDGSFPEFKGDEERHANVVSDKSLDPESGIVQTKACPDISPEEQMLRMEARKTLWECIGKLESKLKFIFVRHFIQEQTIKHIGETCFKGEKGGSRENLGKRAKAARDQVEKCVKSVYKSRFPGRV